MHEVAIVEALIDQVHREVQRSGYAGRVTRLKLVIGRLSGVHCDAIRFAFELLGPESVVDGAELEIDEPRAEVCCTACGARTATDELVLECPACGSDQVTIEGGREMLLQSIELED